MGRQNAPYSWKEPNTIEKREEPVIGSSKASGSFWSLQGLERMNQTHLTQGNLRSYKLHINL